MSPRLSPLALVAAVLIGACTTEAPAQPATTGPAAGSASNVTASPVPYTFGQPALTVDLAESLREISGLTLLPDGRLGAVHDEMGIVYTLDPETGRIENEQSFRGAGDYEGIEWAEGAVWVLRSNGRLDRIPDDGSPSEEFETPLKKSCDAEGLGFDAEARRLLIACKENPGEGLGRVRAIYAFGLDSRELSAQPVMTLDRSDVDGSKTFKPSALAVHPLTRQVYVLSSVRKAIAVLSPEGALVAIAELPEAGNAQPEGLAFTPDGTLYVSNEGPDGPATSSRFDIVR